MATAPRCSDLRGSARLADQRGVPVGGEGDGLTEFGAFGAGERFTLLDEAFAAEHVREYLRGFGGSHEGGVAFGREGRAGPELRGGEPARQFAAYLRPRFPFAFEGVCRAAAPAIRREPSADTATDLPSSTGAVGTSKSRTLLVPARFVVREDPDVAFLGSFDRFGGPADHGGAAVGREGEAAAELGAAEDVFRQFLHGERGGLAPRRTRAGEDEHVPDRFYGGLREQDRVPVAGDRDGAGNCFPPPIAERVACTVHVLPLRTYTFAFAVSAASTTAVLPSLAIATWS